MSSLLRRLDYRLGAGIIVCMLLVGNNCTPGTDPLDDPEPDVNQPPEPVVLPPDLTEVSVGLPVRADATGSTDPEGDALSYEWSLTPPTGSLATLDDAFSATPMFTPDIPGDYDLALELDDGVVRSGTNRPFATVTITAVDRTSATTVDDTGGEVVSSDGRLRIVVPAGALDTPVEIVITVAAPSQFPEEIAALELPKMEGFDVQPAGLAFTAPATAQINLADAYSVVGGQLTATSGIMIRATGADAGPMPEAALTPDAAEPTTGVLSAEISELGWVGVLSALETREHGAVVRANPPSSVPAGDAFDIEVAAEPDLDELNGLPFINLQSGVAVDGSQTPVAPDPNGATFAPVDLTAQGDGSLSGVLDYVCEAAGQGVWVSTVTLEWAPREVPSWVPGTLDIVMRSPIDCVAPDETPPVVTITVPTAADTYATGAATVTLGGTASDDTGVTSVTWANDRGGSGTAAGLEDWTAGSISLLSGENRITVTAEDAAGNSSSDELVVTYTVAGVSERSVSRATWIHPGASATEILIGGTNPERWDPGSGAVTPLGDGTTFGASAAHHVFPISGDLYANDVIGKSWRWNNPTDGWQLIFEVQGDHAQQMSLGTDGAVYGASGLANPRKVGTDFSLSYYTTYSSVQAFWSNGTTDVMIQTGGDGSPAFNDSYPVLADVEAGTPVVPLSGNGMSETLDQYQRLARDLACAPVPGDATALVCLFTGGQTSPGSLVEGQDAVDGYYALFGVNLSANSSTGLESSRISGVGASAFTYMGRTGLAWADQESKSIEVREVGSAGITGSWSIPVGSTCSNIFDFTVTPNGEFGVTSCWGPDGALNTDNKYVWSGPLLP